MEQTESPWWAQAEIPRDVAVAYLEECQENYRDVCRRRYPSLSHVKNNHHRYLEHEFVPTGAVIHASKTRNSMDALRAIARGNYGTHFVVGKNGARKKGELSESVPCNVYAPMSIEHSVPHAGYLSDLTWGIDLVNLELLRAYYGHADIKPRHIYREEFKKNFISRNRWVERHGKGVKIDYYSRYNNWSEPFVAIGTMPKYVNPDGDTYEAISLDQVMTLVILLRALNSISPLSCGMIVPASCVTYKAEPCFVGLNWTYLRSLLWKYKTESKVQGNYLGHDALDERNNDIIHETEQNVEEGQISETVIDNGWRSDIDEELLRRFIREEPDWLRGQTQLAEYHQQQSISGLKRRVGKYLSPFGYSSEPDFVTDSVKLWYLSQKTKAITLADAMDNLKELSDCFRG